MANVSTAEIPQVLIELGQLLSSQHKYSEDFAITPLSRGWMQVSIFSTTGTDVIKCRSTEEVRNVVCNTAEEWLDEKLARKADRERIAELISECNQLVLDSVNVNVKTSKGITTAGIIAVAESKGFSIRYYKGYTYVIFPGNTVEHRYRASLLKTAQKLRIITDAEAEERYENDNRYGMVFIDGIATPKQYV
jgi:hypothetical protein